MCGIKRIEVHVVTPVLHSAAGNYVALDALAQCAERRRAVGGEEETPKFDAVQNTVELSGRDFTSALPFGQPQVYSYTIPGLTKQEALVKAQALLSEISKHEMRLEAHLPADNILTAQTLVTVQGTGTPFDQVYFPDSVIRSMDDGGYRMQLAAKNHSPETTVTL
jgi:hypothetical protein